MDALSIGNAFSEHTAGEMQPTGVKRKTRRRGGNERGGRNPTEGSRSIDSRRCLVGYEPIGIQLDFEINIRIDTDSLSLAI